MHTFVYNYCWGESFLNTPIEGLSTSSSTWPPVPDLLLNKAVWGTLCAGWGEVLGLPFVNSRPLKPLGLNEIPPMVTLSSHMYVCSWYSLRWCRHTALCAPWFGSLCSDIWAMSIIMSIICPLKLTSYCAACAAPEIGLPSGRNLFNISYCYISFEWQGSRVWLAY